MPVRVGALRISSSVTGRSQVTISRFAARATSRSATVVPRMRQSPDRCASWRGVSATSGARAGMAASGLAGEDGVGGGGGDAVGAEAADGEVIAVAHQAGDGVADGGQLVDAAARLQGVGGAGVVGVGVGEEGARALGERGHAAGARGWGWL